METSSVTVVVLPPPATSVTPAGAQSASAAHHDKRRPTLRGTALTRTVASLAGVRVDEAAAVLHAYAAVLAQGLREGHVVALPCSGSFRSFRQRLGPVPFARNEGAASGSVVLSGEALRIVFSPRATMRRRVRGTLPLPLVRRRRGEANAYRRRARRITRIAARLREAGASDVALVTVQDVAMRLGCSTAAVRRVLAAARAPMTARGPHGRWLYHWNEVLAAFDRVRAAREAAEAALAAQEPTT